MKTKEDFLALIDQEVCGRKVSNEAIMWFVILSSVMEILIDIRDILKNLESKVLMR